MLLPLLILMMQPADPINIGGALFGRFDMELGRGEVNLSAADVNEDGAMDLLAASQTDGKIKIFLGDGTGGFDWQGEASSGASPNDMFPADLNADGHVDLLIANHETSYITVLLGDGKGGFAAAPGSPVQVNVDPHPHAVLAVDVNGDGQLDMVVDDRNRGGLLVLNGRGDGRFDGPGRLVDTGGDPYLGFLSRDLNGDGQPDFVTPNPDHVAITESLGNGRYAPPRRIRTLAPFGVALADMTGDGVEDLVVASGEGQADVEVYRGPDFGARQDRLTMPAGPKLVRTGDLNGDGFSDAVFCSWSGAVLVVVGGSPSLRSLRLPFSGNPWGLALADFNGDGRDDLVVADGGGSGGTVFMSVR